MLRLLHMADVHLGARHPDLGEAASALRERQHAALRAAVDLAIAERVDAVLIAGDLFDANTAARRTVERAAAELARLAAERIRVVLIPGDHDPYTRASVYRAADLPSMARGAMVTVLAPGQPWVHLDTLDTVVVGPADTSGSTTVAAPSAFALSGDDPRLPAAAWRIGLLHAAVGEGPGELPEAAIGSSGLDFVALGHEHAAADGRVDGVAWAMAGSPEQVAADRDEPGTVNLVTLDVRGSAKSVTVERRVVGSSWHRELDVDASQLGSQAALVERLRAAADPELVLDVRIVGERPDELDLEPAAIEDALRGSYLCIRVEDASRPPLTPGTLPPPETVAGSFMRNVEAQIAELEAADTEASDGEAADLREVLRLGRRLLAGTEAAR